MDQVGHAPKKKERLKAAPFITSEDATTY